MEFSRIFTHNKRILISAICLALAGCGSMFIDTNTHPSAPMGVIIHSGTTSRFTCEKEDLGFAASSFTQNEFIDVSGKQRWDAMFRLSVSISGQPDTNKQYNAYVGLILYFYSYKLTVHRMGVDIQSEFAEIIVDCGPKKALAFEFPRIRVIYGKTIAQ